jgi:hypothetical protein
MSDKIRITVLVENTAGLSLLGEHGLAFWIETPAAHHRLHDLVPAARADHPPEGERVVLAFLCRRNMLPDNTLQSSSSGPREIPLNQ